jgi:hypothetical protein
MNTENSFEELPRWCDAASCQTTSETTINNKNSSIKNLAKLAVSPVVRLKKIVENRVYGIADYWDSLPKREVATNLDPTIITDTGEKSPGQNLPEHQIPTTDI